MSAGQWQSAAIFEADRVWNLALKRTDFLFLALVCCSRDAVLACIKTQAFSQMHRVCAWHWGTQAFNWRKNLLIEVPFHVRLESRVCRSHICRCKSTFGGRFVRRCLLCGCCHDVGYNIVLADAFALCKGFESNLDLRHRIGIGVILWILS